MADKKYTGQGSDNYGQGWNLDQPNILAPPRPSVNVNSEGYTSNAPQSWIGDLPVKLRSDAYQPYNTMMKPQQHDIKLLMQELDTTFRPLADYAADFVPVVAQTRSVDRIRDRVKKIEADTGRPIEKILAGADIALETLGLGADFFPLLKTGAGAGVLLFNMMRGRKGANAGKFGQAGVLGGKDLPGGDDILPNNLDSFFKEYNVNTSAHPLDDRSRILMNKKAGTADDFAVLEITPSGKSGIRINSIQSPKQGSGNASAALDEVIALAEKNNLQIELGASSYGQGGLSTSQLKDWYKRKGFIETKGDEMVLAPTKPIDDISKMILDTEKNGGGSWNIQGKSPVDGYMVAAYPERGVKVKKLTEKNINEFKAANKDLLEDLNNHVGTWKNPKDGKYYMDISRRYDDKREAYKAGMDMNEQAIFDVENLEDIRLDNPALPRTDGKMEMTHFGREQDIIDPAFYGKGLSGRTTAEKTRAMEPGFVNRSYYGVTRGVDNPYRREVGVGAFENKVDIDPSKIYDARADVLGLREGKTPTEWENAIKEFGFEGYYSDDPSRGMVVQTFGKHKTKGPVETYTHGELSAVPNVPQFGLERAVPKKGGTPKGLEILDDPATRARMKQYALRGQELGGRAWYNLEPLRKAFVKQLGQEQGTIEFNRYADIIAATSPRTTVATNIRRSSLLRNSEKQGIPLDSWANLDKETGLPKKGRANALPEGYGHLAHETQQGLLEDLAGGGHFSGMTRPKTSSFAENLKGNQNPLTIDTHNMAALYGDNAFKKSPTPTQYKFIEEFQAGIAKELGMTPAQFQASVWIGGDTGVADPRPFMDVFRDVLERTAKKEGIGKKEVLQKFISGEMNLWQLITPVAAGGVLATQSPDDTL